VLWLIALAAGLPLAQASAAIHVLSHATPTLGHEGEGNRALVHPAGCEQCLAAHALADAAPQPSGIDWQASSPRHEPAPLVAAVAPHRVPHLGFRSRAPPVIALH